MDKDLRRPGIDNRLQVAGSGHQLEVREDLSQKELALFVSDQLIEPRKPRRPLGSEPFIRPSNERLEAGRLCPRCVRLARGEPDGVARFAGRPGQWKQRLEMPGE